MGQQVHDAAYVTGFMDDEVKEATRLVAAR
jgi:hypothetical protein